MKLSTATLLLLINTSLFAYKPSPFAKRPQASSPKVEECCLQEMPQMAPGLASAAVDVCGWDVSADAAFIYWQPLQDNMALAFISPTPANINTGLNGNYVNMGSVYKPGIKAGLGFLSTYDDWDFALEYTWFHSRQVVHASVDPLSGLQVDAVNSVPTPISLGTPSFTSMNGKWHLSLNIFDLEMGRSHYFGQLLTFRPFVAARAAWIGQNLDTSYASSAPALNVTELTNTQRTHCWGIGPRVGLESDWRLGAGFGVYGIGGADFLYTRYTELSTKSISNIISAGHRYFADADEDVLNALRTHFDLELGLNWGSYFASNTWHIDLSAGYTFQLFMQQNMFRLFDDFSNSRAMSILPNGNLYLHGLNAKVRFDF